MLLNKAAMARKDRGGGTPMAIRLMLLAINVYQAVFNNTGMVEALSNGLMQVCPSFLLRYIHVIMLLLCVVIIYVVPFQIFNALYPVFISICLLYTF